MNCNGPSMGYMCVIDGFYVGTSTQLLSANGGRFEINQLLFANDTVAASGSRSRM